MQELENWKEIERLLQSGHSTKTLSGVGLVLQNVNKEIINTQNHLEGLRSTLGAVCVELQILNKSLLIADESSTKLATALNRITIAGVIIAGLGFFIAVANLIVDMVK